MGGFVTRTLGRLAFTGLLLTTVAACSEDEESAVPACVSDANGDLVLTAANGVKSSSFATLDQGKALLAAQGLGSLPPTTKVRLHLGNPGDEAADEVLVQDGLVPDWSDGGDADPNGEGHHPNANGWGNGVTDITTRPVDKQQAGLNEAGIGDAVEAFQCSADSAGVRAQCARALAVVKDGKDGTTLEVYEWENVRVDGDSLVVTTKSLGDEPNGIKRVEVKPVVFGQDSAPAAACEVYDNTGFDGSAHDQVCDDDALAAQTDAGASTDAGPSVTFSAQERPSEACLEMIGEVAQAIGQLVEDNKQ